MPELKSPLLEKIEEVIDPPKYSTEEETYLSGLRKRMEIARNNRDKGHEEFDGMSYVSNYDLNERLANTFIAPKQNKEDTNFQSGTIRQKLFALLSPIINLNLSGDISAFDKDNLKIQALGDAMEDIILKTNELDSDDEKKFLRQYELLKHGTVFVEELWDERQKKVKKLTGKNKKFDGKLGLKWNTQLKKAFARPSRNIIPGPNVYLGDITKYGMEEQPYIFTADVKPYEEAKMIFGEWDRWKNVSKSIKKFDASESASAFDPNWRLLDTQENQVEILRYQDKWNNEFAVLLNGTLMTPIGLPLPWGYEDYNLVQQNLEPIHIKFAYGKSLVARIRNKVALYDEMMRLAILKTQKSFMPPYVNISGRVLSNRVLMPGKISHGIQPNTLVPINAEEAKGITNAELAMITQIEESINSETTSPTFQGQRARGDPTATEIIELQRQAKMILGLTVFSVSMLEWKLEWLRLQNLLANWFNPQDEEVDEARNLIRNKYRQVSVERPIEGEGIGQRIVIPTKEIPSSQAIFQAEESLSQEQGLPIRLIFINPEEVTSSKLCWQIVIRPKEKRTSEVDKLMFRAFLQDILPLQPSMGYIRERAASVWGEDPQKLFPPEQAAIQEQLAALGGQTGQQTGQQGGQTLSPRVNLPSAESALGSQVRNSLAQ